MYVTNQDNIRESEVLFSIQPLIPILEPYNFVQSKKKTAIYDFRGYVDMKLAAGLDVKVREIGAFDYPTYIISANKIECMRKYPEWDFFAVYFFEQSGLARVYHLNTLELELQENFHHQHQRAHQWMNKPVYLVPASQRCGEVYLLPE